jgi:RimJ/RimL family protein N-acetyltransferase
MYMNTESAEPTAAIRPASSRDAHRLSAFARRMFQETFAAQNTPEDMNVYLSSAFNDARQLSEIEDTDTITLLAENGATLVGYAQLRRSEPPRCVPDRHAIELVRFYVDRALHGRGLAHRLMQATLEAASARAGTMWLGVWERNARAIAFYEKWDFVDVGSHAFVLGSDRQTDRIMWRTALKQMNKPSRVLRTERLLLRPFDVTDAARLAELAGARAIADSMISVPYPLSVDRARSEIARFEEEWESGAAATFAIALREDAELCVGSIAIRHIDREHEEGELSFWISEAAQGNGYASEAAGAVVNYAFRELGLNRVCAYHMVRNAASGHVLSKIGMSQEGRLRQRVRKWGEYEDVLLWAVLRREISLTP